MNQSTKRVDLLAFGAHPDDVEIGVGGIMAAHSAAGYMTAICNCTEAELSSNGTVALRRQETKKAGAILGIHQIINLGLPDRGITPTAENVLRTTQVIRQWKPKIVLAPYWKDRHPDHIACSHLVTEAVFDAAIRKRETPGEEPPHRISHLYYYFIHHTDPPHLIVDISDHYRRKMEAILAYSSQFVRQEKGVETPLNLPTYLAMIQGRDQWWGYQIGCAYGEALISPQPLKQINLFAHVE
jgi:N-acetylglucosamine malate deacetylase 1